MSVSIPSYMQQTSFVPQPDAQTLPEPKSGTAKPKRERKSRKEKMAERRAKRLSGRNTLLFKLAQDRELVAEREGYRPRSSGTMAPPAAPAWWMDPKILLLGAAALLILMRKK